MELPEEGSQPLCGQLPALDGPIDCPGTKRVLAGKDQPLIRAEGVEECLVARTERRVAALRPLLRPPIEAKARELEIFIRKSGCDLVGPRVHCRVESRLGAGEPGDHSAGVPVGAVARPTPPGGVSALQGQQVGAGRCGHGQLGGSAHDQPLEGVRHMLTQRGIESNPGNQRQGHRHNHRIRNVGFRRRPDIDALIAPLDLYDRLEQPDVVQLIDDGLSKGLIPLLESQIGRLADSEVAEDPVNPDRSSRDTGRAFHSLANHPEGGGTVVDTRQEIGDRPVCTFPGRKLSCGVFDQPRNTPMLPGRYRRRPNEVSLDEVDADGAHGDPKLFGQPGDGGLLGAQPLPTHLGDLTIVERDGVHTAPNSFPCLENHDIMVRLAQSKGGGQTGHSGADYDNPRHVLLCPSYWTSAQWRYATPVKRMTPETRREAIVEAAHAVAVRKGLAATTVRDVASEMGTSSGLIHHYFESMDQLLTTVFERLAVADLAQTREAMDLAETPTAKLTAYFAAFVDPRNDEVHQLWLDAWSEAGRNNTLRDTSRALNVEWQRLLSDTIRSGIETGEFDQVNAEEVSWKTLSLLDGLSLQLIAHPTVLERGVAAKWAANSMELDLGLPQGALSAKPALA